jgi:hypothetical protein
MSNLLDIYDKLNKAKHHYEKITTIQNIIKYLELEKQLYIELDKLKIDDSMWLITKNNINKCIYCDDKIICNNDRLLKYKKLIHQYITCIHKIE